MASNEKAGQGIGGELEANLVVALAAPVAYVSNRSQASQKFNFPRHLMDEKLSIGLPIHEFCLYVF